MQLIMYLRESKYAKEKFYSDKKGNVDNYQVISWHGVRCFRSSKHDLFPC